MSKYTVWYEVRADFFGRVLVKGSMQVFAENLQGAYDKVKGFTLKNAKEVNEHDECFIAGGYEMKAGA